MKLTILPLLLFLLLSSSVYSKKSIEDIRFILEESDKVKNNSFKYGIQLFLSNQKVVETKGFLNGKFSWRTISIHSNQITKIDNGVFFVDHNKIQDNNHKVDLTIELEYKRQKYTYKHSIDFPKLDSIKVVNRSIQAYKDNYLSMYGYFSNGKTYLLSPENEYPGFSIQNLSVHVPREIAQKNLFLYYHPNSPKIEYDIPIVVTYMHVNKEICLQTDLGSTIHVEKKGINGKDGQDGKQGSGGDDGYGGHPGENGWNGGFGQQPEDVFIYVAEKDGYFLCWLIQNNWRKKYIINSNGSIVITSIGGDGGNGGNGGEGGQGSHATEEFDAGEGGRGGNGGVGGDGGNGGNIIVYHDLHPDIAQKVVKGYSNGGSPGNGGSGGRGGKDGIADNSETPILGLLSLIIRTRGSNGTGGTSGSFGKPNTIVYECMNSEEYVAIHETFNIPL